MKTIFKIAIPILIVALGFVSVMALGNARPEPEKTEEPQRLVSLYVDEVIADQVTLAVTTHGEVVAKTEIDLYPQVTGRIMSISDSFDVGSSFNSDSVLITLDDADLKLAVIRAEARVAEANVKVEMERADASIKQKQRELYNSSANVAPLALNLPQVKEAEAKLRSAEADLSEARLNLSRTFITVPFKGRVSERQVGVGQSVTPATLLGRVFSTDQVEIKLPLTGRQLVELNLPIGFQADGDNAPLVTLSTKVGNQAHQWQGRIVRTHAEVDQQTRLIYAVAEVMDPYGVAASHGMPLAVGLYVNASIDGADSQPGLVMPRDALRHDDKVYVINGDSKLEIRKVTVLSTSATQVIVSDGVSAGEQVVTSSLPNAFEGMAVLAIQRELTASL